MSEGQRRNKLKKVGEAEETDEKDLNQLKWSKSIRLVAARSRAEWLLSSSPECAEEQLFIWIQSHLLRAGSTHTALESITTTNTAYS